MLDIPWAIIRQYIGLRNTRYLGIASEIKRANNMGNNRKIKDQLLSIDNFIRNCVFAPMSYRYLLRLVDFVYILITKNKAEDLMGAILISPEEMPKHLAPFFVAASIK